MFSKSETDIMSNWNAKFGNKPVVSIKCLVYNHEKYIEQTIKGFLMQITDFPFEVIIHDDASTDGSSDIIREYEKRYPSIIKPIYEVENQYKKGFGAINDIITPHFRGSLIAVCEGDDYWIDEKKLQKQVNYMESHPECGLCFTNFNILYDFDSHIEYDLLRTQSDRFPSEYSLENWIIKAGYTAPMTWLYRRSIFNACSELNSMDGTFVQFAHILSVSEIHCLKDDITAVYRILSESASHSKDINKLYKRNKNLHETRLKLVKKYGLSENIEKKINNDYYTSTYKQIGIVFDYPEYLNALDYNTVVYKKVFLMLCKKKMFRKFFKTIWKLKVD